MQMAISPSLLLLNLSLAVPAEGSAATDSDSAGKPKGVNNSSQQSAHDDEHGSQDLDRTITACSAEARSDGLSAGCLMERDGGARP